MNNLEIKKLEILKEYLKDLDKVILAFSGGIDSTFLLKVCKDILSDRVIPVTIVSPYIPSSEIEEIKKICKTLNVNNKLIEIPIISDIKENPKNRCYLCKKFMFSKILDEAKKLGINHIIDGTNFDDTKDFRPGLAALKELKIKSPLLELGFTKKEIRNISKDLKIKIWDKPPYPCLLTRLEFDEEITLENLKRVEDAEKFILSLGFKEVRVRNHKDIARIEVSSKERINMFNTFLLDVISIHLKKLGYKYVTLDLDGYKKGSLN